MPKLLKKDKRHTLLAGLLVLQVRILLYLYYCESLIENGIWPQPNYPQTFSN